MNSALCGKEVMAFASQILLWSREQVAVSKTELGQLSKLEKAVDDAKNKASSDQKKLDVIEERLKELEADAAAREKEFENKISSVEKQLQASEMPNLMPRLTGMAPDSRKGFIWLRMLIWTSPNACSIMSWKNGN